MKYFCISRAADSPRYDILNEVELKEQLNDEWSGYEFLKSIEFMKMPTCSVFIFKGEVVIPEEITEWKL